MMTFSEYFQKVTGHDQPRAWQVELAAENQCRSRIIRIPTGLGKTEGVLVTWGYHRLQLNDYSWPLRLVWCLPMRVLVEQTEQVARTLLERMGHVSGITPPGVHLAMGGEDLGEWYLYPERPAIIVGTQDMLLSRALNRGYASGRARWPLEFGLLSQDTVWVMDEVQLMDVGLATSAQLQAYRDQDQIKHLRPCCTWWMSATLQVDWLRSVDTDNCLVNWSAKPCEVPANQRRGGLWDITKKSTTCTIAPNDDRSFADQILAEHSQLSDGDFGKITLVVCNTVERACRTFDALRKAGRTRGLELVHSRFRPAERENWREEFLSRTACKPGVDRIIVATQVVEAGVDISAGNLITELAPWPSLVQRFGRCARYGGTGKVVVVDRRKNSEDSAPYEPEQLESAWETIQKLDGVDIRSLEEYEGGLSVEPRQKLYPYAPQHLLLRKEFDELFDTTPDLTGADLDISRFIRSGDERDVHVFWLAVPADRKGEPRHSPSVDYKPSRRELCAVPFLKARDWLCEKDKSRLKNSKRAWVWDWIDGEWVEATREALIPGRIVCVACDSGGYSVERGFDVEFNGRVSPIAEPQTPPAIQAFEQADDHQDGEQLSISGWKTIACHSREVAELVRQISTAIPLVDRLVELLELAAYWHDWGKSHPAFQGSIRGNDKTRRLDRLDLAKAPDECWPKRYRYHFLAKDGEESRPGFRHELASLLGLFSILAQHNPRHAGLLGPWVEVLTQLGHVVPNGQPATSSPLVERLLKCTAQEFNLVAYMVAGHHGKVRVGLHAAPKDQEYLDRDDRGLPIRGVREGDCLPEVELVSGEVPIPSVCLSLSPANVGLSPRTGASWRERCIELQEQFGPCGLAYLEAIMRAADVRASRLNTNDPSLLAEVNN